MSGYIDNLPTANQTFAQTQPLINRNFTIIDTAFSVDHTAMTSNTNQGNHVKVTLISGADPAAVNQGPIFYSKQVTYPGPLTKNELFFRQAIGDGSNIVQLTDMANAIAVSASGSTFLPGGVIIKWGSVTGKPAGTAFTFSTPFLSNVFSLTLGNFNTGPTTTATFGNVGLTGATIYSSNTNQVYYIAIGN